MKHRKSVVLYTVTNPNIDEEVPLCDTLQELADWLGDGLDIDAPVIKTQSEFRQWLKEHRPGDRLKLTLTEENHVHFDEAFIDAQESFLDICDAWGDERLMMEIHADLVAVWEGR